MQPFGRPVVPEVYGSSARSSGAGVCGPGASPAASASLQRVAPRRQRGVGAQPAVHRRRRRIGGVDRAGGHRVGVARDEDRANALARRQRGVGGLDDRRQVGAADHDAGLGVGDVVLELLGAVHRVDRHDDRVGAQHRVQRDRKLRAVLHEDRRPGRPSRRPPAAAIRRSLRVVAQLAIAERAAEEYVGGACRGSASPRPQG